LIQRAVSFTLARRRDKNPLEGFSQAFRGGPSIFLSFLD
jgi:hypothetical protein